MPVRARRFEPKVREDALFDVDLDRFGSATAWFSQAAGAVVKVSATVGRAAAGRGVRP